MRDRNEAENKAIAWYRRSEESRSGALARVRALVVLDGAELVARIVVAYPRDGAGLLRVWVLDSSDPDAGLFWQMGTAGGYGYDKLTAALSGLQVGKYTMRDHCSREEGPQGIRGLEQSDYTVIHAI